MKKLFAMLTASLMCVSLAACSSGNEGGSTTPEGNGSETTGHEIIMLTDKGTIDDKSFNQGTYEGVTAFAEANGKTYTYIKPEDANDEAYKTAIDEAVNDGAKIIVTPGYLFEPAIYEKQTQYPDVKFILIDGYPNDGAATPNYKTEPNTVGIKFKEEQAGYLAGYAAVKDGNTKIGFLGGMAVPAVVNFGFGYVQGANDAAKELGVNVDVMYNYTGGFAATPEAQTLASSWYKDGTAVIFGCGGAVGNSAMSAAEATENAYVIGVDVDQSGESETVISSAYKQLAEAVQDILASVYDGTFKGGENLVLGAEANAVGLPMATSKWKAFSQEEYDALYAKLVSGEVSPLSGTSVEGAEDPTDPTELVKVGNLQNVNVNYIK